MTLKDTDSDQATDYPVNNDKAEKSFIWEATKAICVLMLVGVLAHKIYQTKIVEILDFTAILSLLLAIFSVALSALFYFKSSEISNNFYNHSFNHTKDIALLLSKIESGFGEKLKNLNDGYASMRDYVQGRQNGQHIHEEKNTVSEEDNEIEKEKAAFQTILDERTLIIDDLLENSKLDAKEKEKISQKLKEKEIELAKINAELNNLKSKRDVMMAMDDEDNRNALHRHVVNFTNEEVIPRLSNEPMSNLTRRGLSIIFSDMKNSLPSAYLKDMEDLGYIRNGNITIKGYHFIRDLIGR